MSIAHLAENRSRRNMPNKDIVPFNVKVLVDQLTKNAYAPFVVKSLLVFMERQELIALTLVHSKLDE